MGSFHLVTAPRGHKSFKFRYVPLIFSKFVHFDLTDVLRGLAEHPLDQGVPNDHDVLLENLLIFVVIINLLSIIS